MPLHPLVVHFPIALLLTATLIEVINLYFKKESVSQMNTFLFVFGVLSGLVSLATGDAAEEYGFRRWGNGIHDTVELHSFLAGVSMFLFGAVAVVKLFGKWLKLNAKLITIVVLVFSLLGTATLSVTGHLGGTIVYQQEQTANHE